ncbi:MAG TPA: hypothetical protein DGN59_02730, partial [Candidatus Latescibacteria bacterium]|nr:hypothetical protein [Candidatus Latescibacterota bacterium]
MKKTLFAILHRHRHTGLWIVTATLLAGNAPAVADELVGIRWERLEQLVVLAQRPGLQLRYVHGHVAVFDAAPAALTDDVHVLFRN